MRARSEGARRGLLQAARVSTELRLKLLVVAGAIFLLIGAALLPDLEFRVRGSSLGPLAWAGALLGALVSSSYVYRTWLWWRYRPMATVGDDHLLPTVTIVIPAYNEGSTVRTTIASALASDYPQAKLRVIAIDDGSRDDTFSHMQAAAADGARVELIRLPHNQGKRHALYAGISRARSEVVVTLDSDCLLPRESLRALIAPFVHEQETGCVAGAVKVWNREQSLITRMLDARYLLGFDFVRAYQSQLRTVFCCPGAFAAYRRDLIAPHLDRWRDQRFLGRPCTNGDDHALTNVVLRAGAAARYQSTGRVLTVVPHTYARLSRMFTRWARSNIRESTRYMQFGLWRARQRGEWLAFLDAAVHFAQIPLRLWLFAASGLLVLSSLPVVVKGLASATAVSLISILYYLRSERSTNSLYILLYTWFALLTLQWIYPFAALTVRHNRWMTRD